MTLRDIPFTGYFKIFLAVLGSIAIAGLLFAGSMWLINHEAITIREERRILGGLLSYTGELTAFSLIGFSAIEVFSKSVFYAVGATLAFRFTPLGRITFTPFGSTTANLFD